MEKTEHIEGYEKDYEKQKFHRETAYNALSWMTNSSGKALPGTEGR